MRPFLFDIETCPIPEAQLLKLMPPELLNPIMPIEIANPNTPDMSKCPVYGGDLKRQDAWKDKTIREWEAKTSKAKEDWQFKASEDKQKWINDAALHAPRGQVKVIGIRDVEAGITTCYIADATPEQQARLLHKDNLWPCKVQFAFESEKIILDALYAFTELEIGTHKGGKLIGYWISQFDFRFLIRRSFITGARACKRLFKGRYFDDSLYIDLSDSYLLGERELKIGGLDGLAAILGCQRKTGTGEGFWRIWRDDPCAAINYHLHEMQTIEEVSRKMGVIP